jgi:hypothetical protein
VAAEENTMSLKDYFAERRRKKTLEEMEELWAVMALGSDRLRCLIGAWCQKRHNSSDADALYERIKELRAELSKIARRFQMDTSVVDLPFRKFPSGLPMPPPAWAVANYLRAKERPGS